MKGTGAERDNGDGDGVRVQGTGGRGPGQSAITAHGAGAVHGDSARVYAEGQGGDRGRAR